jgi:uncharacterized DUF497 family protein
MYNIHPGSFGWDEEKNRLNRDKHGISFEEAKFCFSDVGRIIAVDDAHSTGTERRYFCIGRIERGVITVRFTYRSGNVRILGAGFWRKARKAYEKRQH